jgi:UDP-N-acetylglucosamine 2-epimerase (non-hydrolysing)
LVALRIDGVPAFDKDYFDRAEDRCVSRRFFVLFGTRPEAIKLFPVVKQLKAQAGIDVTVCVTAQHREMLDQVLKLTNIVPEIDLDLMEVNQTLDDLSARILRSVGEALDRTRPDRVVVQGDTSTAMMGALAAYYRRLPVSHVEAGLRSGNIYAPWPEEVNRKIIGSIADQHFAPTNVAAEVLLKENVPAERVFVTGNTIVDALLATKKLIDASPQLSGRWNDIRMRQGNRRIILVTTHRRENFGGGMDNICEALLQILEREDVAIILPMHLNPNVRDVLGPRLIGHPRAEIIAPQEYADFVGLLSLAHIVLTDSGGIQEEAPSLGKPVLVMRDTTERPEGVLAGTARLVGTDRKRIVAETSLLLDDPEHYLTMSRAHNPFGDGRASERIVKVMLDA